LRPRILPMVQVQKLKQQLPAMQALGRVKNRTMGQAPPRPGKNSLSWFLSVTCYRVRQGWCWKRPFHTWTHTSSSCGFESRTARYVHSDIVLKDKSSAHTFINAISMALNSPTVISLQKYRRYPSGAGVICVHAKDPS